MPVSAIVLDLDFTLWNTGGLWIDCTAWPFTADGHQVTDARGRSFALYPEVRELLAELQPDYRFAVASRTSEPDWARWLLEAWELTPYFDALEIYPGDKTTHLAQIRDALELPYEELLFFDDEHRNILDVQALGVQAHLVMDGFSRKALRDALETR